MGAEVIAVTSSPQKVAMIREAGANHVVTHDRGTDFSPQEHALTRGAGVEVAIEQAVDKVSAESFHQLECDFGMARAVELDQFRNHDDCLGGLHSYPQRTSGAIGKSSHLRPGFFELDLELYHSGQKCLACVGQRHTTARRSEQVDAKAMLEFLDLPAEGGLGDPKGRRSLRETPGLRYNPEIS